MKKKTKKYQQWWNWYQKHKEHRIAYVREYHKKRYLRDSQKMKERTKKWREDNPERYRESMRKCYLAKKERYIERATKWQRENPQKVRERNKRWIKKNPEKRNFIIYQNRRMRNGAEGSHTLYEWEALKKKYDYTCQKCRKREPEIKLTEDHIIPLIKGGSNYISNIQPLCRSCNSKKHTKIINYVRLFRPNHS